MKLIGNQLSTDKEPNYFDQFDAFEMHPVAQRYKIKSLHINDEDVEKPYMEVCEENDPSFFCWSVYGHIPGQGVECIADWKDKTIAEDMLDFLNRARRRKYVEGRLLEDEMLNCDECNAEIRDDEFFFDPNTAIEQGGAGLNIICFSCYDKKETNK